LANHPHSESAVRKIFSLSPVTILLPALVGLALIGCGIPSHSTLLAGGPDPVVVRMEPAVLRSGQEAMVVVRSPRADSIAIESANGVDRYWSTGPRLNARLSGDFGDPKPLRRYAERRNGVLLDRLRKPATISVCKLGHCREFYHEFEMRLPERNRRTVAIAAGWNTMFAHRTITGRNRTALFQEALSSGVFSLEGELAAKAWSAKAQAFYGADGHGASVDLSRVIKQGDEVSYGVALHLATTRLERLHLPRRLVDRLLRRPGRLQLHDLLVEDVVRDPR
jgi:hypothetical protein